MEIVSDEAVRIICNAATACVGFVAFACVIWAMNWGDKNTKE